MHRISLLCLLVSSASAQTAVSLPQFDVAAIKANTSGDDNSGTSSNAGEIIIRNRTLRGIILDAFDVRGYSFSGPDWLSSVHFDINAKLPPNTTLRDRNLMMQSLLIERFGLKVHHETKTLQGFALVVAKNGSKIRPVDENGGLSSNTSRGKITAERISMAELADELSRQLRQPVNDMTGIKGVFTFTLTYTPDTGSEKRTADAGPSLFTALPEQLGLKLEGRKIPVETLVVDHIEKTPTEN